MKREIAIVALAITTMISTPADAKPVQGPAQQSSNGMAVPEPATLQPSESPLHLTPNPLGKGAVSDGRTYSVAVISAYRRGIPPATQLLVQGVIVGQAGQNTIALSDRKNKPPMLACSMSPEEGQDVSYLYHAGDRVQATGDFARSSTDMPILQNCQILEPVNDVVQLDAGTVQEQPIAVPAPVSIPGPLSTLIEKHSRALLVMIAVFLYFMPWVIAKARRHNDSRAIFFVSFFFGWTVIGWIVVLLWSMAASSKRGYNVPPHIDRPGAMPVANEPLLDSTQDSIRVPEGSDELIGEVQMTR